MKLNKIIKFKIIIVLILSIIAPAVAIDIIVSGGVDETYDDNISSSSTDTESDWITNIALGLAIRSEGRRLRFDLAGNVDQQLYVKHNEENANSQDLALALNFDFSENVSLKLSDVFQHYPESRNYPILFGRNDAETGYISNNFSSMLSFNITKQLFFDIMYNNSRMNNDNDALADSVIHNPGIDTGYSINSSNIIRAGYMKFIINYNNGEKQKEDRGYGEYEFHFTEQLRTILHGGCDYIDSSENQGLSTRWSVSIIHDIDKLNQLNIIYLKENTISNTVNDTFNNWKITASLKREITLRTGIDLSFFYGSGTYELSRETDKLTGASLSIAYIVTDFINFNMGYSYTWSSRDIPATDEQKYDKNTVFAGLSAQY